MGNIKLKACYVCVLYDIYTEKPVVLQNIKIFSDTGTIPISKGNGVYTFLGDVGETMNIVIEAKGYAGYSKMVQCTDGSPKRDVCWLIPNSTHTKTKRLSITGLVPHKEYDVFIRNQEEIMRLKADAAKGDACAVIYSKPGQVLLGRSLLLIHNGSDAGLTYKVTGCIQNGRSKECHFATYLDDDYELDTTRVFKGYVAISDDDGNVDFPIPYIKKDDCSFLVYCDGQLQEAECNII